MAAENDNKHNEEKSHIYMSKVREERFCIERDKELLAELYINEKRPDIRLSVIPVYETNKEIQQRFSKVYLTFGSQWDARYNKLVQLNNEFHKHRSRKPMNKQILKTFLKQIVLIAGDLSTNIKSHLVLKGKNNNDKIVLDITRECTSEKYEGGRIVRLLIYAGCIAFEVQLRSMQLGLITKHSFGKLVSDTKDLLNLFPVKPSGPVVPRTLQIKTLREMADCIYNLDERREAMRYYRACSALIRLRWRFAAAKGVKPRKEMKECFDHVTKRILTTVVNHKIQKKAKRPFFSTKKLDLIDEELSIGMYLTGNYECNECLKKGRAQVLLLKCSGCRRKWYCSQECNRKAWLNHKERYCGTKWRTSKINLNTREDYNLCERSIKENADGDYLYHKDDVLTEIFVFCKDPDTGELFDGLTDRPVGILPSFLAQERREGLSSIEEKAKKAQSRIEEAKISSLENTAKT